MGYTHYWYYNRNISTNEWRDIIGGFSKLRYLLSDLLLADPNGEGDPKITTDYLGFNGQWPQASEPFELYRTREAWVYHRGIVGKRTWFGFCKTENQPYDLAVMMLLLMVSEIAPGALTLESDSDMEGTEWKRARDLLMRVN